MDGARTKRARPLRPFAIMKPTTMKAIELVGDIDEQHRLRAQVPEGLPIGPVRLIVLLPEEDETGIAWAQGIGREWSDELSDTAQDIYTLDDGQPPGTKSTAC